MPGVHTISPVCFEKAKQISFLLDKDLKIQKVGGEYSEFFNLSPEEIIGRDFSELIQNSSLQPVQELIPILKKKQGIFNYRVLLNDSPWKTAIVTALLSINSSAEVDWIAFSIRCEGPEFLGIPILDSIGDGVFIVNKDWKIIEFNKSAEYLTGWKKSEVIGKSCKEVFKTDICASDCILAKALKERRSISGRKVFVKTKDNCPLPISVSASPFIDVTGKVIGGIEVFRDITDEVEKEIIL